MKLRKTKADFSARQAQAPFSITITPSPKGDAFRFDVISEPWCLAQAERYAQFIGAMLADHPARPSKVKRAKAST
jgi:hypothetical protein